MPKVKEKSWFGRVEPPPPALSGSTWPKLPPEGDWILRLRTM
ncbi:hypothetical protein [Rhodoblastus sp.]